MSEKKIMLSISMLVSGREDMYKSLESLKPFRKAFPCEVILVDTGCDREQRSKAEEYADKILDFVWCNDFAKARNAGLNAATGEWFLYLDDDEWFENPKQIIDFFQSGEHRHYKSAAYAVRNYLNYEGTRYETSYPVRMAQRTPELKFVGRIHEYLAPAGQPCRVFADYVHHYGYVFANDEEKNRHATRNIPPLLEMCSQNPGDPGWAAQLAQEYFGLEEREKVIEICKKGLEDWSMRKNCIAYNPAHVGALYSYILICFELLEKYDEEEEWLERALGDEVIQLPNMQPTIAFYCSRGVVLCSHFRRDDACITFLKKYLTYEKRIAKDAATMKWGAAAIVDTVFDRRNLYCTVLNGLLALVRLGDYAFAKECFHMLNWNDEELLGQEMWERVFIETVCSVDYHPLWVTMMQILADRKDGMRELYTVSKEVQTTFGQAEEKEKLSRLYHVVSELNNEHPYIIECSILWTERNAENVPIGKCRQRIEEYFTQLFTKYASMILYIRPETWSVAERLRILMEPMFLQMNYRIWRRALEPWSMEATQKELDEWSTRISSWKRKEDIRYDIFAVKCDEGYLRNYQNEEITLEKLENLLWKYAADIIVLYKPYCKEFVFTSAAEILPEEVQLALKLKDLQGYREQGNTKEALRQVKESIAVYPPMEEAISEYARRLRDAIQKDMQEQSSEKNELDNLVMSLKKVARQYMEQGEKDAARDILLQIQACMPEDQEVKALLS